MQSCLTDMLLKGGFQHTETETTFFLEAYWKGSSPEAMQPSHGPLELLAQIPRPSVADSIPNALPTAREPVKKELKLKLTHLPTINLTLIEEAQARDGCPPKPRPLAPSSAPAPSGPPRRHGEVQDLGGGDLRPPHVAFRLGSAGKPN